ncbi:sugar ABC transporter permease [Bradyrhizobium sp. ISRA464]|uniref:carbohydrate ABC transporter permease n=2 Tax=unclassified Bradyrhizobium TaxID=2631580 RepID=UPI002479A380|nr:sugar ABC transporter permease [Bradyrhizobium sp. ISRA464]WGS24398.1 sugar ABC transporter permease [Bradyrhizobium sp. ISRA464]
MNRPAPIALLSKPRHSADSAQRLGWLMLAPTLAMLAANSIFPLFYALSVSLRNYQMLIPGAHRWIGLSNYLRIFGDPLFWSSLHVTLWFLAGVIFLQFPVGMALALLVNRLRRYQNMIATLLLIPTIISSSVAAFQWTQLFNYQFGPVNYVLGLLHLGQPTWTADPSLALPALIFVDFWQWTPFMTLLLFAGLRSLPDALVEAARMDGSTGWQIVWRIYLPLLRPVIGIALILRILMTFKLFDIIYVLTAGGPGTVTENLAFFTYIQGFRYFNLGYASALAILQLIIVSILAKALIALTRRSSLGGREAAA